MGGGGGGGVAPRNINIDLNHCTSSTNSSGTTSAVVGEEVEDQRTRHSEEGEAGDLG